MQREPIDTAVQFRAGRVFVDCGDLLRGVTDVGAGDAIALGGCLTLLADEFGGPLSALDIG